MGTVVVDANIVIAFLDAGDAQHADAISALRPWLGTGNNLLLPASVYAEILIQPLRAGLDKRVEKFIQQSTMEIVAIDRSLARRAAELRAAHPSLRLPDAFVLGTAIEKHAQLLTLDRQLRSLFARIST